jgi:hypothetical protein
VIAELGHYALMLALGLAVIQASMPIVGARTNDPTLLSVAAPAALGQFVFMAASMPRRNGCGSPTSQVITVAAIPGQMFTMVKCRNRSTY